MLICILTGCLFSQDDWTALHLAAHEGKISVVRLLIEAQAEVNIQTKVHSLYICHIYVMIRLLMQTLIYC